MNEFDRLFANSGLSLDRLKSFLAVAEAGNLSKAAQGGPTPESRNSRQSQFSRQVKELEGFFGIALTRRVGRRIEITDEGKYLAALIRRQFRELDDFREAMAGRNVSVRIGSQGSIIDWLLLPRLGATREALGNVLLETEQMRTMDVLRAVSDGRLDFGILREDAIPGEMKRWKLGRVGYSLFAAKSFWRGRNTAAEVAGAAPMADLLPGGQFSRDLQDWVNREGLRPHVIAKVSSFTDLARIVRCHQAAAVLPELAEEEFDPKAIRHEPIPGLKPRSFALVANSRSLERSGIDKNAVERASGVLRLRMT